jgi:ADP-heptose:LPS heptosyltransferase
LEAKAISAHNRKSLIVNFNGIGNGLWILPMLKRLEETEKNYYYFHSHNPVFETTSFAKWLQLKNFLGNVPAHWRRFAREDWETIELFLAENEIDLIINLRNEGPLRDKGYFQFKEYVVHKNIEFWELEYEAIKNRTQHRHLIEEQINLFKKHGINISSLNRHWLRDYVIDSGIARPKSGEVGFFTGVSQDVKRWSECDWIELGHLFLENTDLKIVVYAGQSQTELELAHNISRELQAEFSAECCLLFENHSLDSLCAHLSGLDLLISNDTFCVHMSASLDVPTLGLYFSTDSSIWGGFSDKFSAVQSQFGLECKDFKKDAGNCNFYYSGCPAPCKSEVTPHKVFKAAENYILSK